MTNDVSNLSGSGGDIEPPEVSSDGEPTTSLEPTSTPIPNPTPTPGLVGNSRENERNGAAGGSVGNDDNNRLQAAQEGMDPTAERILISVGSIGTPLPVIDLLRLQD